MLTGKIKIITTDWEISNIVNNYFVEITTVEFGIDRPTGLLITPFFATLPNLIQHSPLINFGEFYQSPLLFQIPRLLIHVHSRQR